MKRFKFNEQTGCNKIDIYVDGVYYCSTDQSKTLKAAKEMIQQKVSGLYNITCKYDKP